MKTIYSALILSTAILLGSCAEPDYPTPTPSVAQLTSRVTAFHAIAGGPRVQLKFDNAVVRTSDTIRYEAAPNGKFYNVVTIAAAPAAPNRIVTAASLADGTNLASERSPLVAGSNYSYFVVNKPTLVNQVLTPVPSITKVTDDLTAADVGFAKVRFLNFAYDADEVKVTDVGGANTIFSARKYNEIIKGSGASAVNFASFTSIAANTYNFEVRLTSNNSVVLTLNNIKLDSKGVYTIYAKGLVAGSGPTALGYTIFKH